MRIRVLNELLITILLAALLGGIVHFSPDSVLCLVLGLPVLVFCPGYALLSVLYPVKDSLRKIEWITFSLAVSIAIVCFIGLILNYTPWGINLTSALISNCAFIIITAVVAWCRRFRVHSAERFTIQFDITLPFVKTKSTADRVISGILTLVVVAAVVTMVYAYAAPQKGERFTEFYILGPDGRAIDYPRDFTLGQGSSVTVGIINHEYELVNYRIEVEINGRENLKFGPVALYDGEKWEDDLYIVSDVTGDNQTLEFYLYKNENNQPSTNPLRLWINIKK